MRWLGVGVLEFRTYSRFSCWGDEGGAASGSEGVVVVGVGDGREGVVVALGTGGAEERSVISVVGSGWGSEPVVGLRRAWLAPRVGRRSDAVVEKRMVGCETSEEVELAVAMS